MRSKKVLAIVLANLALIAVFAMTQNCGRVNIAAPTEEKVETIEAASLAVSVSSELVVKVKTNTSEIFAIPTNNGSASIEKISFDPQDLYLEKNTDLQGKLEIDSSTWNVTYEPATGLIGNDHTVLYVTGSDKKQIAINVVFLVGNDSKTVSETLNALVYGDSTADRKYLANKLLGAAPPGMAEIFGMWQTVAGPKVYANAASIDPIPSSLAYCDQPINLTTGLYTYVDDPVTAETTKVSPGGLSACVADPAFIARSWVLRQDPERIYCASNAGLATGFVSPLSFDYYQHEASLSSISGDDDGIGLIMAYVKDGSGSIHILAAVRTQGGGGLGSATSIDTANGWGVAYYKDGKLVKTLASKAVGPVPTNRRNGTKVVGGVTVVVPGTGDKAGWAPTMDRPRYSKVKVVRTGNLFRVSASPYDFNETALTVDPASELIIDADDVSKGLAIFKGARPYGYMSYSQLGSDFRNVKFSTGATETYVYDLPNKIVYEKQSAGGYAQRMDLDAFTHIGAPRQVGNPDTGKLFQLNVNKTFLQIN